MADQSVGNFFTQPPQVIPSYYQFLEFKYRFSTPESLADSYRRNAANLLRGHESNPKMIFAIKAAFCQYLLNQHTNVLYDRAERLRILDQAGLSNDQDILLLIDEMTCFDNNPFESFNRFILKGQIGFTNLFTAVHIFGMLYKTYPDPAKRTLLVSTLRAYSLPFQAMGVSSDDVDQYLEVLGFEAINQAELEE